MPPRKKLQPKTFDDYLALVVDSKRTKRQLSVEELAAESRIEYSTLRRRLGGAPFTVNEINRIAAACGIEAHLLVDEALRDYGGMTKLLAEYGPKSEPVANIADYRQPDLATAPEEELKRGSYAAGTDDELEQDEHFD